MLRKKKHLDFNNIVFPEDKKENILDEHQVPIVYKEPEDKDHVYQYDKEKFDSIKNIESYSESEKEELKFWCATPDLNIDILNKLDKTPSLERLEMLRWIQLDIPNTLDFYLKYINELSDTKLFQTILFNLYVRSQDESQSVQKLEIDDDTFFNDIQYRLILIAFSNEQRNLYDKAIRDGFFVKDKFSPKEKDDIIIGYCNDIDLVYKIKDLKSLGVEINDSIIQKILEKEINKKIELGIDKSQLYENTDQILSSIYEHLSVSIVPADKLKIEEKPEEEQNTDSNESDKSNLSSNNVIIKQHSDKIADDKNSLDIIEDNDNENQNEPKVNLDFTNEGFHSADEIRKHFDNLIELAEILKETTLKSFLSNKDE